MSALSAVRTVSSRPVKEQVSQFPCPRADPLLVQTACCHHGTSQLRVQAAPTLIRQHQIAVRKRGPAQQSQHQAIHARPESFHEIVHQAVPVLSRYYCKDYRDC